MKLLLLIFSLLPLTSIASDWSSATNVNDIYAGYKGGMVLFNTTSTVHSPNPECNNGIYSVEADKADVNHVLSVLLAAQRSGANISVGVSSSLCS